MALTRGMVFATTTEFFTNMARKTARNMRAIDPDLQIDLFTDQDIDDPVFDQIHALQGTGHRPKMEAMRRNRFDLSFTVDSDIIALAPFREIFDVLERFDLAMAHAPARQAEMMDNENIPRAFPLYNSGVMGVRKSDATQLFLQTWEDRFRAGPMTLDQPVLRPLLWESDLRICDLPTEYNYFRPGLLNHHIAAQGAPRLLHLFRLEKMDCSDVTRAFDLDDVLNPATVAHIKWLIAADNSLGGDPDLPPPSRSGRKP